MLRPPLTSALGRWVIRVSVALLLAVAFGYLPYRVYGGPGLGKLMELRRELAALETKNQIMRAENERLAREVRALRHDLTAIERVAREELGLVRPGEIVFQFEAGSEDAPRNKHAEGGN